MPDTVLIAAASDGIAYHLAHRLCVQGHPTVLVTPLDGELDWIVAELVLLGADVRAIACDLETSKGTQALFDELAADGVSIDMLVNTVGHARHAGTDVAVQHGLSNPRPDLATAQRMTALFLPGMLVRGHGRILNLSSAVGSPCASPDPASETLLLAWTGTLAKELAGSPVTIAAFVNPASGRDACAGTDAAALQGEPSSDPLTPRALADAAYRALRSGNSHIVASAARARPAQPSASPMQQHVHAQRFAVAAHSPD